MFESSSVRAGGEAATEFVSLQFVAGQSTQSITVNVQERVLKIGRPNAKASFDTDEIDALVFEERGGGSGVLSLRLSENLGGREMVLGIVSGVHWTEFQKHLKQRIRVDRR